MNTMVVRVTHHTVRMQGAVLTSSDRGGVRIQFSKNPFGKKRDYGGNYVQMPGDWGSASGYTAPAADAATTAVAPPGVAPGTGEPPLSLLLSGAQLASGKMLPVFPSPKRSDMLIHCGSYLASQAHLSAW